MDSKSSPDELKNIIIDNYIIYDIFSSYKNNTMDIFHIIINYIAFIINALAIIITVWGVSLAIYEFIKKELQRKSTFLKNEKIRIQLGSYLILALELFIASDIIRTVITPTWQGLGILVAIIVIRTILSYFLTKDIKAN